MGNIIDIPAGEHSLKAVHRLPEQTAISAAEHTLFLMSHSFPGDKTGSNDILSDLEHLLVEKGCHTLRFDYRGCGESGGKQEDFNLAGACEDFKQVIHWAESQGYTDFAFIGEGLGATISIMNVGLNVKMMALFWPVLDMNAYGENLFDLASNLTEAATQKGFIEHNGHKIGLPLIKELRKNNLEYALKEVFMPVLIIQGAQDKLLPPEQLNIAREHMRSKRIDITTFHDGDHAMDQLNHRSMIFHHVAEFARKNI